MSLMLVMATEYKQVALGNKAVWETVLLYKYISKIERRFSL